MAELGQAGRSAPDLAACTVGDMPLHARIVACGTAVCRMVLPGQVLDPALRGRIRQRRMRQGIPLPAIEVYRAPVRRNATRQDR